MLWSHKVCRWHLPWAGVAAVMVVGVLAVDEPWVRWAGAALLVGTALVAVGTARPEGRGIPGRSPSLPA